MKCHVAFITIAKILRRLFRPLVRLGKQHAVGVGLVECGAYFLDDRMSLREVFAIGTVTLAKIRNGVEPHSVHAHVEPEHASYL